MRNKKSSPDKQQNIRNNDISTTADPSFQEYQMDALLYLKTTIVSDQNLADFKEKLKMTFDIRYTYENDQRWQSGFFGTFSILVRSTNTCEYGFNSFLKKKFTFVSQNMILKSIFLTYADI